LSGDALEADRDTANLLKAGRWFGGLPAVLQDLIIERSARKSYRKGDYIVREGKPPKAMHVVLSGRVRVTRKVGDEQEELLVQLGGPGFWFGDYAVYASVNSIGSIVADTAVTTLALTVREFERIVQENPGYFRAFADLLFERYADLFRYLGESHGLAPEEWLRTRLIDHAAVMRRDNPAVDAGVITLSQAELAAMMGVSRQTLSTLLGRLEARGIISVGFRSIRVLG
jgi:CRP/FNR family transcriptional regulator, cyclic AMP receptor protein